MAISTTRAQRGITLLELLLAMALAGMLLTTLVLSVQVTLADSTQTHDGEQQLAAASAVLSRIESGVRLSDQILQAADGLLVLSTRYFVDSDAGIEKVRYTLSGTSLYEEVADESSVYGSKRLLLENVSAFTPHSLTIKDAFSRNDYDTSLTTVIEGVTRTVDTTVKTVYSVKDLGDVDPDLVDSYDTNLQRLEITGTSGVKTVTVTPAIPKDGLSAGTNFTPLTDGAEYRPITWGDEAVDTNNVSVVFTSDQKIRLRSVQGGATVDEQVASFDWKSMDSYVIRLDVEKKKARAFISVNGGDCQKLGDIDVGSFDNKPVQFQTVTTGATGAWDALNVDYPLVDIHLAVTSDGETQDLWGGAYRRQP